MKKLKIGLLPKILIAIALGVGIGLAFAHFKTASPGTYDSIVRVFLTINGIFG